MRAASAWVFVRVRNWKSRLLIVHSAGLIHSHWQTRNIDSQKYQCSCKAVSCRLYNRVSYSRAVMCCAKGDINLKSIKNEHCTRTLKRSATYFPWLGCKECNVCHLSALANSWIFWLEMFFGTCSEFCTCTAHQTNSNTGSDILVCPPHHLELLYRAKPLLPFWIRNQRH